MGQRRGRASNSRQRAAPSGVDIQIAWRLRTSWRALRLLRRIANHVLRAEGFRTGHLSIAVVGGRAMSTLNTRFHDTPGPTDVLSFDLDSDAAAGRMDAEIVLCAHVARKRARGGTLQAARAELGLYLVHGILHVAGFDDHRPADFRRMHAREDELLTQLGFGPVFDQGS